MVPTTKEPLFVRRLKDDKRPFYCVLAVAGFIDLLVFSVLWYGRVPASCWLPFTVFALPDALMAVYARFTNFHFRYSHWLPWAYAFFNVLFAVLFFTAWQKAFFETAAGGRLIVMRVLIVAAMQAAGYYSIHQKRKPFAVAGVAAVAICATFYAVMALTTGVYGQGSAGKDRVVRYEWDAGKNAYTVTGILHGRSAAADIPATFRGQPVYSLQGGVFGDETLKEIRLENALDMTFVYDVAMQETTTRLSVPKTQVNALKTRFLTQAVSDDASASTTQAARSGAFVSLYNQIVPGDLEKDEVCIVFTYSPKSMSDARYQPIHAWFGHRGDAFSLQAHAGDLWYADHYDIHSEDYLFHTYQTNKKVMLPLQVGDQDLNGRAIEESITAVAVSFDDVYAVNIADDNDDRYDMPDAFCQFNATGYRFVLGSDPADLLSGAAQRDGFDLTWRYQTVNGQTGTLTALSEVLPGNDRLRLYPVWQLRAPVITAFSSGRADNAFVYGETVSLSGDAEGPAETISLRYRWSRQDTPLSDGRACVLDNVRPDMSGNYTLSVTAYSDTLTSLTAETVQTMSITVDKREITLNWSLPADTVYSGTDKAVSAAAADGVINGDAVALQLNRNSVRVAGMYVLSAILTGDADALYRIRTEDQERTLTIEPKPLPVQWSADTSFVYDGNPHAVTAEVSGVAAGDTVELVYVDREHTNVGSYSATVSQSNRNYVLSGNTQCAYTVTPRPLTLNWSDTRTFVYNGAAQAPQVISVSGAVAGDADRLLQSVAYQNRAVHVGNAHAVTASIADTNYQVTAGATCSYAITPKSLTLTWPASPAFVYNGAAQRPSAALGGVVSGDTVTLQYSDCSTHVGAGDYRVTVTQGNGNYQLPANAYCDYTITPKPLTLTWPASPAFVYNGAAQRPSAALGGVVSGDTVTLQYSDCSTHVGAGNYRVTVTQGNGNYQLPANAYCDYTITPKTLTLTWPAETTVPYDGSPKPFEATVNGQVAGHEAAVRFDYYQNDERMDQTPAEPGQYTVRAVTDDPNYHITGTYGSYTIVSGS